LLIKRFFLDCGCKDTTIFETHKHFSIFILLGF